MANRPDETTAAVYKKALKIIGNEETVKKLFEDLGGETINFYWLHRYMIEDKLSKSLQNGEYNQQQFAAQEELPIYVVRDLFKKHIRTPAKENRN